jgi:hypothetical protein
MWFLPSPAGPREEVFWSLAALVVVLLMRRLLMRVFSNSFGRGCTLGQSWAVEAAQEQVDRDTPVSRTPTSKVDYSHITLEATMVMKKALRQGFPSTAGCLSMDFVLQEHRVPHDRPKDSNAGGYTREIEITTKHGDGSLETPESTTHCRAGHRALPRFRALVVR